LFVCYFLSFFLSFLPIHTSLPFPPTSYDGNNPALLLALIFLLVFPFSLFLSISLLPLSLLPFFLFFFWKKERPGKNRELGKKKVLKKSAKNLFPELFHTPQYPPQACEVCIINHATNILT
jgi:hypothetical protein